MKYVIDTHGLIWFLEGNSRLGANAKIILSHPDSQLVIPATTLAEAVWIVERGRTSIPSVKDLLSLVEADLRVVIYPLDKEVIETTIRLCADLAINITEEDITQACQEMQNTEVSHTLAATKLSEQTLQKIWDNPDDAEYDKL